MKKLSLLLLFVLSLTANDKVHQFAKSEECKACHYEIYNEYEGSMHANATPTKDAIHRAVWDKHPANTRKNKYICGKCHTPAANNLDDMIIKGRKATFDNNNETHQEAISCAYCHRIESIELHTKSNTNIINPTAKNYYGTKDEHASSPFHAIDTNSNKIMRNGNVCIGCHSHKMNKHKLNVCSTNIANEMDGANCVSCHMPKVDGHAFHGFAGSHFNSEMLAKYVEISIIRNIDNFVVNINNNASHALLLHPLRVAVLKISVTRAGKTTKLKKEVFIRVIGKDGKPAMPWIADTTIKDTMIKANEKRVVKRDFNLLDGDKVDVVLGWFLVNPKAIQKLGLADDELATKFHIFKKQSFKF